MKTSIFSPILRTLCAAVMVTMFSLTALADTIVGTIRNHGPEAGLELEVTSSDGLKKNVYKIDARTQVLTDLQRLKTGDLVTAQGWFDSAQMIVHVDSIDSLGIQQLLGAWRSDRYEIFEFKDFSQLNLYIPTMQGGGNIAFSRTHSLSYLVAPGEGNSFTIFITDDKNTRMAFLEMQKNKLTMTVTGFDKESGLKTENISLSPLFLQ